MDCFRMGVLLLWPLGRHEAARALRKPKEHSIQPGDNMSVEYGSHTHEVRCWVRIAILLLKCKNLRSLWWAPGRLKY